MMIKGCPSLTWERDLKKECILQNVTRRSIFHYIEQNPGAYFNLIRTKLSLPTGQLLHHLDVLLKEDFVRKQRDGRLVRFFTYDHEKRSMNILSEKQSRIFSVIKEIPDITQKEIIERTGICQSTTSWILSDLKKSRLVMQTFVRDASGNGGLRYRTCDSLSESFYNCSLCGRRFIVQKQMKYCPYYSEKIGAIDNDYDQCIGTKSD